MHVLALESDSGLKRTYFNSFQMPKTSEIHYLDIQEYNNAEWDSRKQIMANKRCRNKHRERLEVGDEDEHDDI